jgi:hypothetical protein
MKGRNKSLPFQKTAACPSSTTLLNFRMEKLSQEVSTLVRFHLDACDFCRAEVTLLGHHQQRPKREEKTPEIPMNLRILAESILYQSRRAN